MTKYRIIKTVENNDVITDGIYFSLDAALRALRLVVRATRTKSIRYRIQEKHGHAPWRYITVS